jgi:hypothetical protein
MARMSEHVESHDRILDDVNELQSLREECQKLEDEKNNLNAKVIKIENEAEAN